MIKYNNKKIYKNLKYFLLVKKTLLKKKKSHLYNIKSDYRKEIFFINLSIIEYTK